MNSFSCGRIVVWLCAMVLISCKQSDAVVVTPQSSCSIRAADVSFLPQIEAAGVKLYNLSGEAEDMLTTLKNAGCNTIRLRLWYAPSDGHSGFAEVKSLAQRSKALGLKVWLTVHYSDTCGRQIHRYVDHFFRIPCRTQSLTSCSAYFHSKSELSAIWC